MILRVTAATWPVPAARRETGLRPPGKPECFQHSRGVGWAPGEEAQSARQGRTNSAIACVLPAAFQMKAQLLVTGKSPKARRDRDIPLQTSSQAEGQCRWGLSMILCLAREELSTPWEAWHRLLVWLSYPTARPQNRAPVWHRGTRCHRVGTRNQSREGPSRAQGSSDRAGWKASPGEQLVLQEAQPEQEAEEGCCSWRAPQSSRPAHSPRPRVSHHASHDHREEVLVAQPHIAHQPRVLLAEGVGCALELHADLNEAVELDAGVGGSLGVAGQQQLAKLGAQVIAHLGES